MIDKQNLKSSHITRGADNIFADLGFDEQTAAQFLRESDEEIRQLTAMKKQVMVEITAWIEESGMKQVQAAKLLQVTRPRVSDVVNQKTEKFTLDSLVAMACNIGKKFELVCK